MIMGMLVSGFYIDRIYGHLGEIPQDNGAFTAPGPSRGRSL